MGLLFLVDESVNRSVSKVLQSRRFEVRHSTDVLGPGATDANVVRAADELKAIVVDANPKHFQRLIARRRDVESHHRFAGRISLRCNPARAAARIASLIKLIKEEWERRQKCRDTRVIIDIFEDKITISR